MLAFMLTFDDRSCFFYRFQVTKDIDDAEYFLDHMSLKLDAGALGSDPEQLIVKLAEEEVCAHHS